ncbi:MAG: enoyl-CoA hydratase/isomerase family protein [Blastocatellia bacterium]|nr:enoyl-CoA hydratase/isomerase family protein [Blastocatellia bacterium]
MDSISVPTPMTHIQFAISNRVAYIVLNRPPMNVLTIKMMREINQALDQISKLLPGEVCSIVFVAAPGSQAFSAGTAVEEHRAEVSYQMLNEFHLIYRNLTILGKPVVGVVNGQALGGGCELVASCDLVIATPNAKFAQPEIRLGVFPPMASILLPRVIGVRRTAQMLLTGEVLDAQEALKAGLINYVVPEDQLATKSEELLNVLRGFSGPVLECARRALHTSILNDIDEIMEKLEDQYLNQLMSLKDPHEGLDAFLNKRKPVWKHR